MYCKNLANLKEVFRAQFEKAKSLLLSGKSVDIDVKEHFYKRTNAQNAYYWVFNTELASFLNDSGCTYGDHHIPYSPGLIHLINKAIFHIETTTKMSVGEFIEYMDRLFIFWGEETNGTFQMSELPATYLRRKGYEF